MRNLISLSILSFSLLSCQTAEVAQKELSLEEQIKQIESRAFADQTIQIERADSMVALYTKYAQTFPEDSMSLVYQFRSADMYRSLPHKGLKAIKIYNQIFEANKGNAQGGRAVFMIGFTFDELYKDAERAKKSYTYFIENYPEHPMVVDAKNLILLLDGGEEDLVKSWAKENNKNIEE